MISYDNTSPWTLVQCKGSVVPRCLALALGTFAMGVAWAFMRGLGLWPESLGWHSDAHEGRVVLAYHPFAIRTVCVVLGWLITVRSNMALSRWMEGIGSIQSMLSYWTDAFDQINAFLRASTSSGPTHFRYRVAHHFALMSCIAILNLHNGEEPRLPFPCRPVFPHRGPREAGVLTVFHLPTQREAAALSQCADKVHALSNWIMQAVQAEVRSGGIDAPPPIVTRIHNELYLGIDAYHQALKISQCQFPFPFAQMTTLLLMLMYLALPLYMDSFTANPILTPLVCFVIPLCYRGLSSVAVELEEPFGSDVNDVDLQERHEAFVRMMEDVLAMPWEPPADATLEENVFRAYAERGRARPPDATRNRFAGGWCDAEISPGLGQAKILAS